MSVKIRLARAGKKKAPFYRVVATDTRSPRDGRFIEILGRYNPRTDPSTIEIDVERVDAWLGKGAQMSETVTKLYEIAKNPEAAEAPTGKTADSAKDKARAEAEEKAKKEAEEAAAKPEEPAEAPEALEAADDSAQAEEVPAEKEAPTEDAAEEAAPEEEEETPAEAETSEDASDEADEE